MLKRNGGGLFRQTQYEHSGGAVVKRMRHEVTLQDGHFYVKDVPVGGTFERRRVITARGFEYLASIAGLVFTKPHSVLNDEGIYVDNPIIKRSGGVVEWVKIREVLVGRSENGNLRAIDLTLSYDVAASLSSTLFGDWMESGQPAWGMVVNDTSNVAPSFGKAYIGGGNYFAYSLKEMCVLTRLREHARDAAVADRAAATLVERNLMRRYFGFTEADENARVTFYSWPIEDIDWESIDVEDGIDGAEVETAEEEAADVKEEDFTLVRQIQEITRRVGRKRAQEAAQPVLDRYGVRWGDIGAIHDYDVLLAIHAEVSKCV